MTLRAHVDRYVALKRHLGYKFVNYERMLRSWAAWAMTRGDDIIVAASAVPKMRVNGRGEDVIFFDGVFFKPSLKSIFFVS